MSEDKMFIKIKNSLRTLDNFIMPIALDKTNPRYSQTGVDNIYKEYKKVKGEVVNKMATQMSESDRGNYETLLRDIDDHIAKLEPFVSNGLAGGKRRNKRSYKKSRRCSKKTRRCRKKRTSRRK